MFGYHFLGHFFAELIEICCGSLLNSILKTYRRKFLKTLWICFHPKKSEMSNFLFFRQKMIKNLIFNKSKNPSVRFFIYMFSMCVQLFTAFEEAVLKWVSALKSNMAAISMETNRGKKFVLVFSPYLFTDHNKYTMKWLGWEMSKTVFRIAPPP